MNGLVITVHEYCPYAGVYYLYRQTYHSRSKTMYTCTYFGCVHRRSQQQFGVNYNMRQINLQTQAIRRPREGGAVPGRLAWTASACPARYFRRHRSSRTPEVGCGPFACTGRLHTGWDGWPMPTPGQGRCRGCDLYLSRLQPPQTNEPQLLNPGLHVHDAMG